MRIFLALMIGLALGAPVGAQELSDVTVGPAPPPVPKLDCSRPKNYLKCQVAAQVEAAKEIGKAAREGRFPDVYARSIPVPQSQGDGVTVYRAQDCIGAVVNGVCHGAVNPSAPSKTCHGAMINGACTGPMF